MNYFKVGFYLAIGWTCGKAVSAFAEGVLEELVKDTHWYQETVAKAEKPKQIEVCSSKPEVVKNRIGFV